MAADVPTVLLQQADLCARSLATGQAFGQDLTSEVSMKLHLACGPGTQWGAQGSEWTPAQPPLPQGH